MYRLKISQRTSDDREHFHLCYTHIATLSRVGGSGSRGVSSVTTLGVFVGGHYKRIVVLSTIEPLTFTLVSKRLRRCTTRHSAPFGGASCTIACKDGRPL